MAWEKTGIKVSNSGPLFSARNNNEKGASDKHGTILITN